MSPNLGLSAGGPRIAFADRGDAYVIWQDQDMPRGKADFDIFFRRSHKPVNRLSRLTRLGTRPGEAYGNLVATRGHSVYVAWEEFTPDGPDTNYEGDRYDVMLAVSTNGGATFQPAILANPEMPSSGGPQLAIAPDGTAYLAWSDSRTGEVYLRASHDGGHTLGPMVNISNDAAYSMGGQITVDAAGAVHAVWMTEIPGGWDIAYAKSEDGTTFSAPLDLTAGTSQFSYSPQIAVANGIVYLAWNSDGVLVSRSLNGGLSFELPQNVTEGTQWPSIGQLAASGTNVYVLFSGYDAFFEKSYLARSNDSGGTFAAPVKLSDAWSVGAHLVANGDRADLVWADRSTGNFEVLYTRSMDGGKTWTALKDLSNTPGESTDVWMATRPDGTVGIVWAEDAADVWWTVGRGS